jgi:hypothetical protein
MSAIPGGPVPTPRRWFLSRWLGRNSLIAVAALGGAVGVAYAAHRHHRDSTLSATAPTAPTAPAPTGLEPAQPTPAPVRDTVVDTVQIALLLDTSSSMDGLINQARSHLWGIVERMGGMTRVVDGKVRGVKVELALYEYGNSRLSPSDGYIRQVLPLTSDLDRVSEALHGLVTNGGEEYAGQAITVAVRDLAWSKDPNALRLVFIAGNEGFGQGPVTPAAAMAMARDHDVDVQLIHCGGADASWTDGARLAGSDLTNIDQDRVARHIAAPQDAEILRLGSELNRTYVAYGAGGQAAMARQAEADASSARLGAKVAVERSKLKAKGAYKNREWDLVDALEGDATFLERAADDELPAELRGKPLADKQQYVAAKAAERAAIKAKIAKLEAERAAFIAAEEAKQSPDAPSLGSELLKSTAKPAARKGWKL